MPWHYATDGQQLGPVTDTEFEQLVRSGAIKPETRVWQPGMGDWQTYASISAPGAPPIAGSGVLPNAFRYGGFWLRVVAKIIDGVIGYVLGIPIALAASQIVFGTTDYRGAMRPVPGERPDIAKILQFEGLVMPLSILIAILYVWFFLRKFDATPGKMALGLKVLRPDGTKLSSGRIIGRYFAEWLSVFTLGIGYIIAGFDEEKRALHDRVCDTRVVKAR